MRTKRPTLYINGRTGDLVQATKAQAKNLPKEYEKVEFVKNSEGKRVMRLHLEGATVDISENETTEVAENVNTSAN